MSHEQTYIVEAKFLVRTAIESFVETFQGRAEPEKNNRGVEVLYECLRNLEPSLFDEHVRHGPLQDLLTDKALPAPVREALCDQALDACSRLQISKGQYVHRGLILYFKWHIVHEMEREWDARRLSLLTVIEDFLRAHSLGKKFQPNESGAYGLFQLLNAWTEADMLKFEEQALQFVQKKLSGNWWSEEILEYLLPENRKVSSHLFASSEGYSRGIGANGPLFQHLIDGGSEKRKKKNSGRNLELLASLMFSSVPGVRVQRDFKGAHQIDVLVDLVGAEALRLRLGNLLVVECKDWGRNLDITVVSKLAATMSLVGASTGVIFTKKGITGGTKLVNATKLVAASWTKLGVNILIFTKADLVAIANGSRIQELLIAKQLDNQMLATKPNASRDI